MSPTDWHAIVTTSTAIIYLLAAGAAFWMRRFRPRAARIMILYALLSFGWTISQTLWGPTIPIFITESLIARLTLYGLALLAIVFLFLTLAFLYVRTIGPIWPILSVAWVTGAVVLEAFLWRSGTIQTTALYALTLGLCGLGWGVFMGGAAVLTARQLWKRNGSRYQTAAAYWMIVVLFTAVGNILFMANLPIPGSLLGLAGALLAVSVISQPHLVSIGHIFRRSLSYIIYLVAALVIYTIGLTLLLLALQNWSDLSLILTGLALAVALLIVFNPVLSRLRTEIAHWITGDEHDPTYIMRQYSQTITNILDLKLLASVAVGTASEFLEVKRGYLFLVEYEKDTESNNYYHLHGVKGAGGENPEPIQLREDCPLAVVLREEQMPVTQSEIDFQSRFKEISPEERAWLSGLEAEVYVPIIAKNEWIGLMALGPKMSGGAYTEHDLGIAGIIKYRKDRMQCHTAGSHQCRTDEK